MIEIYMIASIQEIDADDGALVMFSVTLKGLQTSFQWLFQISSS